MNSTKNIFGQLFSCLPVLVLLLSTAPSAHAQSTDVYQGPAGPSASGLWSLGSNWSLGAPPVAGENVQIEGDGGGYYDTADRVLVGQDMPSYDTSTGPLGTLTIDNNGVYAQPPFTYGNMYATTENIGVDGFGWYLQQGYDGSNTVVGDLTLGLNAGSTGWYTIEPPQGGFNQTLTVGGNEYIGVSGSAEAYFANGGDTNNTVTGNVYVGYASGTQTAPATDQYNGVMLSANNEYVGYGNNYQNGDTADLNAYSNTVSNLLDVGFGSGTVGTVENGNFT
jgi:hypothetical protein